MKNADASLVLRRSESALVRKLRDPALAMPRSKHPIKPLAARKQASENIYRHFITAQ
jgi:hypothetical protein